MRDAHHQLQYALRPAVRAMRAKAGAVREVWNADGLEYDEGKGAPQKGEFALFFHVLFAVLINIAVLAVTVGMMELLDLLQIRVFAIRKDGQSGEVASTSLAPWVAALRRSNGSPAVWADEPNREGGYSQATKLVILDDAGLEYTPYHMARFAALVFTYTACVSTGLILAGSWFFTGSINSALLCGPFRGNLLVLFIAISMTLLTSIRVQAMRAVALRHQFFMNCAYAYFQTISKDDCMGYLQFASGISFMVNDESLRHITDGFPVCDDGISPETGKEMLWRLFDELDKHPIHGASWMHQLTDTGVQVYRSLHEKMGERPAG